MTVDMKGWKACHPETIKKETCEEIIKDLESACKDLDNDEMCCSDNRKNMELTE